MLLKFFKFSFLSVSSIIVLGIIIYTFYDSIMALGSTTIYLDSEIISDDSMVAISTLEDLQQFVREPANGYDITNSELFFEMLCSNSGVLDVEVINGVHVNVITVNNRLYTVHPDLIQMIIDLFQV